MEVRHFHQLICLISFAVFISCAAAAQGSSFVVGDNPGGPTTVVTVNSGPLNGTASFSVSDNLTYDGTAGNLLKDFTNTSQGKVVGQSEF